MRAIQWMCLAGCAATLRRALRYRAACGTACNSRFRVASSCPKVFGTRAKWHSASPNASGRPRQSRTRSCPCSSSGMAVDPAAVIQNGDFWAGLEQESLWNTVLELEPESPFLREEQLEDVALAFAD